LSYIRNLDGLRALAVVGVVAFHLSETHLPGGFIGVDVFFVISGFIITRGLRASGDRVGFADFYARRMARLLPAATVTIIVTLLVSAAILAPEDREQIAATALAALAFASNIFFRFNAGYFDDALAANPLLHFWSLSVEEQFYLVWPLLIVGLTRLGPARAARWIAGLTLGAIVLSWSVERHDSTLFFYAMPMRAFQFLLGACLVYFEARPVRPMLQELIFASGMALVLIPFFVADGDDY
jgi:peptidoglycan/LPS O-acetylase OafA/YrhL